MPLDESDGEIKKSGNEVSKVNETSMSPTDIEGIEVPDEITVNINARINNVSSKNGLSENDYKIIKNYKEEAEKKGLKDMLSLDEKWILVDGLFVVAHKFCEHIPTNLYKPDERLKFVGTYSCCENYYFGDSSGWSRIGLLAFVDDEGRKFMAPYTKDRVKDLEDAGYTRNDELEVPLTKAGGLKFHESDGPVYYPDQWKMKRIIERKKLRRVRSHYYYVRDNGELEVDPFKLSRSNYVPLEYRGTDMDPGAYRDVQGTEDDFWVAGANTQLREMIYKAIKQNQQEELAERVEHYQKRTQELKIKPLLPEFKQQVILLDGAKFRYSFSREGTVADVKPIPTNLDAASERSRLEYIGTYGTAHSDKSKKDVIFFVDENGQLYVTPWSKLALLHLGNANYKKSDLNIPAVVSGLYKFDDKERRKQWEQLFN